MRNPYFLTTCLVLAFNIFNLLPGSYQITTLLRKGGTGEVYRARDTKPKREVAFEIPDEFSRDRHRVSWFQREAEVLTLLNHPNFVAI